jgi:hypothetical protein
LLRAFGEFTMWLTILLTYCALCWVLGVAMTVGFAPQFAERAADRGVHTLVFQLGAVLIAPLAMPLIVWSTVQMLWLRNRHLGQLRQCLNTVREYEFTKVNSLHLAEPIRRRFDRFTPDFFQLGFNLIGDYRMKPEPVEVHDRIFLSNDGETLGTICAVLKGGGESMITVLSDGTCVHTTSSKNPKPERTVQPQDQLCITYLPGVSIEDQFQQHQATVREQCSLHGTNVVPLHAEQFREVLVYDQRIFNCWRHRLGDLDKPPPMPDLRTVTGNAVTTVHA